jgi:retron-type reverse transcriptase
MVVTQLNQQVEVGNYHYFTIHDPKERTICAATFTERVLHHAIMNICHPVFEKFQIFDSYATRPGKGQYAALDRAKLFTQHNQWFCKLDIRKYFDSISHTKLNNMLKQQIKDQQLLVLLQQIVKSYCVKQGKGIPIGNLTSQYFANFYLGYADHFIKEVLKVRCYVRYMDDMVLWDNSKEQLIRNCNSFVAYIQNDLELSVKPPCIHQVDKGVPFLGYVLYKNIVGLNKNSKKRFIRKYKEYEHDLKESIWTQRDYSEHITPLFAFAQYANTKALRSKLIEDMEAS